MGKEGHSVTPVVNCHFEHQWTIKHLLTQSVLHYEFKIYLFLHHSKFAKEVGVLIYQLFFGATCILLKIFIIIKIEMISVLHLRELSMFHDCDNLSEEVI